MDNAGAPAGRHKGLPARFKGAVDITFLCQLLANARVSRDRKPREGQRERVDGTVALFCADHVKHVVDRLDVEADAIVARVPIRAAEPGQVDRIHATRCAHPFEHGVHLIRGRRRVDAMDEQERSTIAGHVVGEPSGFAGDFVALCVERRWKRELVRNPELAVAQPTRGCAQDRCCPAPTQEPRPLCCFEHCRSQVDWRSHCTSNRRSPDTSSCLPPRQVAPNDFSRRKCKSYAYEALFFASGGGVLSSTPSSGDAFPISSKHTR